MSEDRRRLRTGWLAWLIVLLVAAALLAATSYRSRDPDSALHALISARLAELPFRQWIAPEWWGGMRSEGPYREHPVGIFLLPALLGKAGYPHLQAAYAVNAVYQVLTLVLVQRVAAVFVTPVESRALAWMLQLLPIAFTYRIRANHEQAILLCLLAALLGTERARTDARWLGLTALGVLGTLLVKGVFALFVLAWCALWLVTVRRADGGPRSADAGAWVGLGATAALSLGVGAAYERAYRAVTGTSFLAYYLGKQLGDVVESRTVWSAALHKLYNFVWYGARVVWFPFPASLVAMVTAWSRRDAFARVYGQARPHDAAEDEPGAARTREGLVLALGIALAYLVFFSLADRKADRYIFPAYWLVGAAGLVAAIRAWPALRRVVEALDRHHAVVPPAVWLAAFALSLAAAGLRLPRPKFWIAD